MARPTLAGWLPHLVAALALGLSAAPVPAQDLTGTSSGGRVQAASGPSAAAVRYVGLETALVAQGRLRDATAPRDAPWDAGTLAASFARIALSSEYQLQGGGLRAGSTPRVLRRWTEPVRIGVRFGASVPAAQRRRDVEAIAGYAGRLRRATGHPVAVTAGAPNLLVLVAGEDELRGLDTYLRRVAPDMSRGARRAITGMPPGILCLAVARPHDDPRRGYRGAIAVVRAEHPARLRRSCIEEELAQAMGLPDDSPAARPSIFNDDEEFGVLTRHDEALLRMLYDPRLSPGMTPAEVVPLLPAVAADAMRR